MLQALAAALAAAPAVTPACYARLDKWCSCHAHCGNYPHCGKMKAAIGSNPAHDESAWRCYPATELTANRTWIPTSAPANICTETKTLSEIVRNCSTPVLPPACPPAPGPAPRPPLLPGLTSVSVVFTGGTGGCVMYRTPSFVLLKSGKIVAFTQCRLASHGDDTPQEIHMKTSVDDGRTWSASTTLEFAADPLHNSLHRAQTVYDATTGAIFLFDNPHPVKEDGEELQTEKTEKEATRRSAADPPDCSIHIWRSDDEGVSWRSVANTTDPSQTGSGLTVGVQLPSGKLVVPHRNGCNAHSANGAHALWSNDHGATWAAGAGIPPTAEGAYAANECNLAPLANGSLLMIARSETKELPHNRISSVSDDEGRTWSRARIEPTLAGFATCEGSLFSHAFPSGGAGAAAALFYSHPQAISGNRSHLTIRRSQTNGDDWPNTAEDTLLIHAGPSAYSCLGRTAKGELAVLWEADGKDLAFATTMWKRNE